MNTDCEFPQEKWTPKYKERGGAIIDIPIDPLLLCGKVVYY
jgi:hypothetical protein